MRKHSLAFQILILLFLPVGCASGGTKPVPSLPIYESGDGFPSVSRDIETTVQYFTQQCEESRNGFAWSQLPAVSDIV